MASSRLTVFEGHMASVDIDFWHPFTNSRAVQILLAIGVCAALSDSEPMEALPLAFDFIATEFLDHCRVLGLAVSFH